MTQAIAHRQLNQKIRLRDLEFKWHGLIMQNIINELAYISAVLENGWGGGYE